MDTSEQEQKREYIRVHLRKHREKMKAIYGTTYTPSQKKAVINYQQKVKKLSGKFPSPYNDFRIKNNVTEKIEESKGVLCEETNGGLNGNILVLEGRN